MTTQALLDTAPAIANREAWLRSFMLAARPAFEAAGYPLPDNIRIGVGFPSRGARGRAIAEVWASVESGDGTFEIIISPTVAAGLRVADMLTHELCHIAVGLEHGHKAPFARCARAMGLEGPAERTIGGEAFKAWAEPILWTIGDYPHAELSGALNSAGKAQKNRQIKAECDCGYIVRSTRKWFMLGMPICPQCLVPMKCEIVLDHEADEPEDEDA